MPLKASPVGLLGCFAPSGFMLCTRILGRFTPSRFVLNTFILSSFPPLGLALHARILLQRDMRFALTKIFEKSVSQSTRKALKRIEMQKIFLPL